MVVSTDWRGNQVEPDAGVMAEEEAEEEAENEFETEGRERAGLPKEDEFVRKVLDPKLRSEEE
eukprot:791584-Karenia_brevis.AAC.1